MNILSEFIHTERAQYAVKDNNKFAFALGQALGYYHFLLIILERYGNASKEMVSNSKKSMRLMSAKTNQPTRMTGREMRLMEEQRRLTTLVHLEIESFYLFAKIFLDDVALFLHFYFGTARNVSLESHNNLEKCHEEYFKIKGLSVPQGLSKSIILLKERICDYRDKRISHQRNLRRIRGTVLGVKARIVDGGTLYPREDEMREHTATMSEELPQLMEDIDTYTRQVITLIQSNRDRTRLELKGT